MRLARALRVARVLILLPNLRVLIYGIVGGLSSIANTGILISLMVYIYGLCGVFFFGKNDPFHFSTLGLAAATLLRLATLDNWVDVYDINYYGCTSSDFYVQVAAGGGSANTNTSSADDQAGDGGSDGGGGGADAEPIPMDIFLCLESASSPVLSTAFFGSYIVLSYMILLSMFVGAISISMAAGIEKIQEEALERRKAKRALRTQKLLSRAQRDSLTEIEKKSDEIDFIPDHLEKAVANGFRQVVDLLLCRKMWAWLWAMLAEPTIEEENHKRELQALLALVWEGTEYNPVIQAR